MQARELTAMRMPIRFIWSGGVIDAMHTGIMETLFTA